MIEGDKIKVNELGCVWDGEIVAIVGNIIETKHRRSKINHPEWNKYPMTFVDIYTRHFDLTNIII